jgi:hypothetical protein
MEAHDAYHKTAGTAFSKAQREHKCSAGVSISQLSFIGIGVAVYPIGRWMKQKRDMPDDPGVSLSF